ncbi:hypothetical protein BGY98DRAFT_935573 [Russula aff. rugulosa BPL654]|nr:hypothetical protein BGY98DRAFT_935573 [Russula aff. rugulosa BPL654]
MRAFLSLFIAALISAVSASLLYPRDIPGYPECAQGCLANATSSKCQPGEVQCLCEDPVFVNSTTTCFVANCNGTDLTAAESAARQNCDLAGVTLTPSGTSSSAAAASSSTGSSKSNSAESTMVNIMGAAAALGLAVLAL